MNVVEDESTTVEPEEAVVTTESMKASTRDFVEEMIDRISVAQGSLGESELPGAERVMKEAAHLKATLEACRPGVIDLTPMLKATGPSVDDLRFIKRWQALSVVARKRLMKSKLMFPEPMMVLDAVTALTGDIPLDDVNELRTRFAHFMAHMNMTRDGVASSTAFCRIMQAAVYKRSLAGELPAYEDASEKHALVIAAENAILNFLVEARKRGRR